MNVFTIINEDKFVSVDGVGYSSIDFELDPSIHAVQWYGNYGEIEYSPVFDEKTKTITKPPNEIITDYSLFQSALDAWLSKNEEVESQLALQLVNTAATATK